MGGQTASVRSPELAPQPCALAPSSGRHQQQRLCNRTRRSLCKLGPRCQQLSGEGPPPTILSERTTILLLTSISGPLPLWQHGVPRPHRTSRDLQAPAERWVPSEGYRSFPGRMNNNRPAPWKRPAVHQRRDQGHPRSPPPPHSSSLREECPAKRRRNSGPDQVMAPLHTATKLSSNLKC